jgi:predicted ATPase/DNA-binding CsgD family transcriptional regulator
MSILPQTRHNLPSQPTSFIGREDEIAEIVALLDNPACRLLTLVGLGGIGKTRLALEVAARKLDSFPNGVFFAPLQPLTAHQDIVSAIAAATGLQFYDDQLTPRQQLLNYLCEKQILLILDNFEHLLDGADLLPEILDAAPRVKILVTSRERLRLREEWGFDLGGLTYPEGESASSPQDYSGVQLFLYRARRATSQFSPAREDWLSIARICRLVEGMPLAIELAAAWVRVLPCQEIASQIERSLEFLTTAARNVPAKHSSMQTVFDWSWGLLNEAERDGFSKLSVFRGGFSREAAEEVAGVSLQTLAALADKSLLRLGGNGRYDLHELMRQYAEEQLDTSSQAEAARDTHCAYYAAFLGRLAADLKGANQIEALAELEAELDNVRAGWRWAAAQRKEQEILQSLDSLGLFYQIRGRFQEAEEIFGQAAKRFEGADSQILGELLGLQAWFSHFAADQSKALDLLERSVSIFCRLGVYRSMAMLFGASPKDFNACVEELGSYEAARQFYADHLEFFRQRGDQWAVAWALHGLGHVYECYALDQHEEAERFQRESVATFRVIGDRWGSTWSLNALAHWAMEREAYDEARQFLEETLAINQVIGDIGGVAWSLVHLGIIADALRDHDHARQYIIQGLKAGIGTAPGLQLHTEPHVLLTAQILEAEGRIEQAVELLAFFYTHSRYVLYKIHPLRDKIAQQLDRLKAQLAPDVAAAAVRRGETVNLESIRAILLEALLTPEADTHARDRPQSAGQALIEPLRERELEVLQLIADGLSTRETAQKLFLSVGTIRWYLKQIYSKLRVHSRTQAIARARELKLLT